MKNIIAGLERGLEVVGKGFEIYEELSNLPYKVQEAKKAKKIFYLEMELEKYAAYKSGDLNLAGQTLEFIGEWLGFITVPDYDDQTNHIIELKRELALRKWRASQHHKGINNRVSSSEHSESFGFVTRQTQKKTNRKHKKKKNGKHKKKNDVKPFSEFM